jgi:hypothetical protein
MSQDTAKKSSAAEGMSCTQNIPSFSSSINEVLLPAISLKRMPVCVCVCSVEVCARERERHHFKRKGEAEGKKTKKEEIIEENKRTRGNWRERIA